MSGIPGDGVEDPNDDPPTQATSVGFGPDPISVQFPSLGTIPNGLTISLIGCFPGDPENIDLLVTPEDTWGPLDLQLPKDVFVHPDPRSAQAAAGMWQQSEPRPAGKQGTGEAGLPALGSVIDKYRIEELLGTGGFAAVYRATHLLLRIPVALKLMRPKLLQGNPTMAELLCEEARFAAQVNHPNVVRVVDVTHNRQITYIVMEFIDGESLQGEISRHGPLAPARVARVGLEVTRGLQSALGQGMIHRDIKPANILMARSGAVKIVDLGLAQHMNPEQKARPTESGLIVGTPAYMAPEQATTPDEVDFKADVYSLGATLYHAATGRPPFQATDMIQVIYMHQTEPLTAPEALVPGFPFELSRVIAWMLEKQRSARPDYDQLLAGLEEALTALSLDTTGTDGLV